MNRFLSWSDSVVDKMAAWQRHMLDVEYFLTLWSSLPSDMRVGPGAGGGFPE